jgi:hypothetical protein
VAVQRHHVAWPAKALTSIISVLRGRWKLVSSRSTTRKRKPGVMKMSVSPCAGRVPCPARGRFQRAQRGGAHGHDAAAAPARVAAMACDRLGAHLVPLAVHAVFGQALHAHRLEGAGAHVQRHRAR